MTPDTGTPSPLSLRALRLMQAQIANGVKGGDPARFRGPEVDVFLASVNLDAEHLGANGEGYPWCAADCYYVNAQAETPSEPSHCPRTGGALHMAALAPAWCKLSGPRPGAWFILDRGHGKGHVGVCEYIGPLPSQVTTCEPDTNGAGSSTGDAAGRHSWDPDAVGPHSRGTIVGRYDWGLQPPAQEAA